MNIFTISIPALKLFILTQSICLFSLSTSLILHTSLAQVLERAIIKSSFLNETLASKKGNRVAMGCKVVGMMGGLALAGAIYGEMGKNGVY